MIKKYVYNEKEYSNSWEVRQAIDKTENTAFGPEPTGEYEEKKAFWEQFGVTYTEEPEPEPTPEEIASQELEEAKRFRAAQVAAIQVTVDGMVFDGDETAQSRMARALETAAITGMESTVWVLADNSVATVTVTQLQQALSKAMLQMSELWTIPYEGANSDAS